MTAEVVIGRLRSPLELSEARSAVAALEPLACDYGRGILMVRSLRSDTTDPQALRRRVDELRRASARPALGTVDPHAEAVFFADEAELLLSLSEDLLHGRAGDRWWWASRLHEASTPEATLAHAWIRQPRWVPSVMRELLRRHRRPLVETLRRFDPVQARAVIAGIEDVYLPKRAILTSPHPHEPGAGLGVPLDLIGPARILLVAAVTIAEQPSVGAGDDFRTWLREACATASYRPVPGVTIAPTAAAVEAAATAITSPQSEGGEDRDDGGEMAEVIPLAPWRPEPDDAAIGSPPAWSRRPWEGSGTEVESEMATALYAVNLVGRLHLESVAGHQSTGWAVVEAIIRRLLRELNPRRRSALLADPLLPLLGELDTRPLGRPNPVRRGPWSRAVSTFLQANGIDVSAFTHPGRIVVSRTHVDVVLSINQIDLAVRASGLDQDPGWAPYFGRVILFHFEDLP